MSTPIIFDFDHLYQRARELDGKPATPKSAPADAKRPMKMGRKGILVFICSTCDGSGILPGTPTKFCDECTEPQKGLGGRKYKDSYY